MKARELLRRYAEGERDFCRANLRGQSFKGENLSGADFREADIRSADFSNANLTGANFRGAKGGLQKRWAISLVGVSFLLSAVSGYCSSIVGFVVVSIFNSSSLDNQITSWVGLIVVIIFCVVTIRQGIATAFGALAVAVAGALVLAFTGAGILALTGAVTGAGALAFALTLAFTLAVAGAVAGTLALAFAVAGTLALAFVLAIAVAVAGAIAVAVAFAVAEAFTLFITYIAWRAIKGDEKQALIRNIAVAFAATGGTNFRGANLTDTDFTGATLKNTDLRNATLTRTCWQNTKKLDLIRPGKTYLKDTQVRQLLLTRQGQDKNFDNLKLRGINLQGANLADASFIAADLSEANLQDADLSRAKLKQTQLDETNFTGATLTGSYIEDWGITSQTNFTGVRCEYVYMRVPTKNNPDPLRKPDNNAEVFTDGEFGDFIKPIVDTLDLYHNQGVDPRAIAISFKELAENNPDAELEIVAIEKRGGDKFLLRAKTSTEANKSELSTEYFETYNYVKALAQPEIQALIADNSQQIRKLENVVTTVLKNDQRRGILLLSANPVNTTKLRLDEEIREIKEGLKRAKQREQFVIDTAEAVRYRDIHRAILDHEPQILHFSGHGSGEDGLAFEDEAGNIKLIDAEALGELFELFSDQIECVVLNACYSQVQATAIAQHINYVIGMNQAIPDKAGIEFAIGFYDALGAGRTVDFAYKLGCNLIKRAGVPGALIPQLLTK
ncbi:pentapeptide repeat-containing protein [Calothrix rhizosoleniae]|uniref:pentapeptide repeat-containing protein n=1 Tax=Calothrix rhizosoleniae TaxID=888997 RepID=UPI000B497D8C|nr:pentapeptide repeat-containing protein [Calothrix rhizosoleniae]